MTCPHCSAEVAIGSRFCNQCGTSLSGLCPSCGAVNSPDARFCDQCGTRLGEASSSSASDIPGEPAPYASEQPLPYAERRQLTVLFSDLIGSTPLSEQLDPEDLREILRDYQAICSQVINLYEGYLAKYLGDGVLAYFGYPTAHEDDAQRGVQSGLEIIKEVGRLRERNRSRHGIEIDVRVGIHTGLVVVGDMGSSDALESNAIVGQTPNMAARIQSLADRNGLVISADTYRLTRGFFECVDLDLHELKGLSQPVRLYRVLNETTVRSRLEAIAARLTPFTGREGELAELEERWNRAENGEGEIVLVNGEPGVGKSRLILALKEKISDRPDSWLTEIRCSPLHQNTSLYPVIDFLERVVLRFEREEVASERLRRVREFVEQYEPNDREGVALIASLLSLPPEAGYEKPNLTPQKQKERTIDLLIRILLDRAERQTVLFVFEDLHWSDPSTLQLLDRLLEQCDDRRILILLAYRPQFKPYWTSRTNMLTIDLTGLPQSDGEMIITRAAGRPLPKEAVRYILQKTDGIPLFLEELTKTMIESNMFVLRNGNYELVSPLESLAVPTTLQDSLTARLDRLREAKSVAQLAATIGREFSYEMLDTLPGSHHSHLRENLDHLVEAGLLFQKGIPPGATYLFKHALVQDSAYSSLLKTSRRTYHQLIGESLERNFPELVETQPELIAHHYMMAELPAKAIPYLQKAGEQAIAGSAIPEAIAHLSHVIDLIEKLPAGPERTAAELMAQTYLGLARMMEGGYASPEVQRSYSRARDLCRELGDPPQLFPVLHGLVKYHLVRAEYETGTELARQLLATAGEVGNPELLIEACYIYGAALFWTGHLAEGLEQLERVVELYDPVLHRTHAAIYGEDPCVVSMGHHLWGMAIRGLPDQSIDESAKGLELAHRLNHPWSLCYLLVCIMIANAVRRDMDGVRRSAEQLADATTEHGFPFWNAAASVFIGWCRTHDGEIEEGIEQTRGGISLWRTLGADLGTPNFYLRLSESLLLGGKPEESLEAVEEGLAIIEQGGEDLYRAEAYRLRGGLLLQGVGLDREADRIAAATGCFQQSLQVARQQGGTIWQIRTLTDMVRMYRENAGTTEAAAREATERELRQILDQMTEGKDLPDVLGAYGLLSGEIASAP